MARWSFLLGSLGLLAYAVGPLLANVRLSSPAMAFSIFLAGTALGVLGLVLGVISIARRGIGRDNALALPGLSLCLLLVLPVAGMAIRARRFPPINDITTNPAAPPEFKQTAKLPESKGISFNYPGESAARQQQAGYPDVKPLLVNLALADTFDLAVAAAKEDRLLHITVVDGLELSLEGYEESQMFRFRDDFVVEVRQAPPGYAGSLVEMRSRSRDGVIGVGGGFAGDMGGNAARIRRFLEAVHAKALHKNSVKL